MAISVAAKDDNGKRLGNMQHIQKRKIYLPGSETMSV